MHVLQCICLTWYSLLQVGITKRVSHKDSDNKNIESTDDKSTNDSKQTKLDIDFSHIHHVKLDQFDFNTDVIAIPERGVIYDRVGTLLMHPTYDIMTVVVAVNKPPNPLTFFNKSLICPDDIQQEYEKFWKKMLSYNTIAEAIFQSRKIFETSEICNIHYGPNNHHCVYQNSHTRQKRFGSYILAGAAMGTASAALAFATANRVQLYKLEKYIKLHSEDIEQLQSTMTNIENKQQIIIDTQKTMMGYLKSIDGRIRKLETSFTCFAQFVHYQNLVRKTIQEVENLIQFILLGSTTGKLSPTLIDPKLLQKFLSQKLKSDSKLLIKYPSILYQTAEVVLIKSNFDDLQFTFLIMYPIFKSNPIYPYFIAKQTGSLMRTQDQNETMCIQFAMPPYAIIKDNKLFVLNAPLGCKNFGNIMICDNNQINLFPVESCLKITTTNKTIQKENEIQCPIIKCDKEHEAYVSIPAGLLLRTYSSLVKVQIIKTGNILDTHKTEDTILKPVPPHNVIFVPWEYNVSAVHLMNTVIYSPTDVEHFAHVSILVNHKLRNLSFVDLLDIPIIGSDKIAQLMKSYEKKMTDIENSIDPKFRLVKNWAQATLQIPYWIKAIFITISIIVAILCIHSVYKFLFNKCKRAFQQAETINNPAYTTLIRSYSEPSSICRTRNLNNCQSTLNSRSYITMLRNPETSSNMNMKAVAEPIQRNIDVSHGVGAITLLSDENYDNLRTKKQNY